MKQKVLLTPGPLTTSKETKEAMLIDMGTRDSEYQSLVCHLQEKLLQLAHAKKEDYALIFMQGSGTFGVESVLTSVIKPQEKVLIVSNGAYGKRMVQICEQANIKYEELAFPMTEAIDVSLLEEAIARADITHVAYVHCETTAGILNDITSIQHIIHKHHKVSIVDAMSSFGSMDIDIPALHIDYLITSANKCLHGVSGVALIYARKAHVNTCAHICKSLSLDLYAQYKTMEEVPGSFRFTSPTHVLRALDHAVEEGIQRGGFQARHERYATIQQRISHAMQEAGFHTLVDASIQSVVITTYRCPKNFDFNAFYDYFKANGFLLYSGKLPGVDAFRIGNIGELTDADIDTFLKLLARWRKQHETK